jgi:hypothetical protein
MKRSIGVLLAFLITFSIQSSAFAATSLPGMPRTLDPKNIYAADVANALSATVKNFPLAFMYQILRATQWMLSIRKQ